jgi:REP element-mobilizing transposase RayT
MAVCRTTGSLHQAHNPQAKPSSAWIAIWMQPALAQHGFKREDIADIVAESIHFGADHLGYYSLHAYVILSNHVHVLVTPLVSPSKLLQSVKGYSAREANKLLERTGEPFWQPNLTTIG